MWQPNSMRMSDVILNLNDKNIKGGKPSIYTLFSGKYFPKVFDKYFENLWQKFWAATKDEEGYCINYSQRCGNLEKLDENCENIIDVFYSDEFINDGTLVYYERHLEENPNITVSDLLEQDLSLNQYIFLKVDKIPLLKEISQFEIGSYIILFEDREQLPSNTQSDLLDMSR